MANQSRGRAGAAVMALMRPTLATTESAPEVTEAAHVRNS
jgi:hypothetical protein